MPARAVAIRLFLDGRMVRTIFVKYAWEDRGVQLEDPDYEGGK